MSLLSLSIHSDSTSVRSGTKNGRDWKIRTQDDCFLEINGERRRFPVNLESDQAPFPPGEYQFDVLPLIQVGQYGLEINRFKQLNLKPVVSAVEKKPLFAGSK